MKQKLEFYRYTDQRTGSKKIDIIDANERTLATLDNRDFKEMKVLKKDTENLKDIVSYCNLLKGCSIGDFEPVIF